MSTKPARKLTIPADTPALQAQFWIDKVREAKDGDPQPLANAVVEILDEVTRLPEVEKQYIHAVLTGALHARTRPGRARMVDAQHRKFVHDVLERCKNARERAAIIIALAALFGVKRSTIYDIASRRRGDSGK